MMVRIHFKNWRTTWPTPQLLSRALLRETLFLSLAISMTAGNSTLVREEEGQQKPVCYVSQAFRGAEGRYPCLEKFALTLITTAKRLRPYFLGHPITTLTDHLLKVVLQKPKVSRRMTKWSIELSELDLKYKSRPSVKGQKGQRYQRKSQPQKPKINHHPKKKTRWKKKKHRSSGLTDPLPKKEVGLELHYVHRHERSSNVPSDSIS